MPVGRTGWTPRSILSRAREVVREEGVRSLLFRVLGELGYRRVALLERELPVPQAEARPLSPGVRFDVLRPDAIEPLLTISAFCDEPEARRRLAAGHICMLGYVEDRPVYCAWLALAGQPVSIDFLRLQAEPGPGYAYSYELYVDPAFRGAGIAKAALAERIRLLRELGLDRLVSVVVPENRAGMGHSLASGLRPIGRIRCLRLFGFQRCWIDSAVDPAPLRALPSAKRGWWTRRDSNPRPAA